MPNRTEPTTTEQNDPFNKYKAAKLNEDEAKRLRQMEIEAAAAASASVSGADMDQSFTLWKFNFRTVTSYLLK